MEHEQRFIPKVSLLISLTACRMSMRLMQAARRNTLMYLTNAGLAPIFSRCRYLSAYFLAAHVSSESKKKDGRIDIPCTSNHIAGLSLST